MKIAIGLAVAAIGLGSGVAHADDGFGIAIGVAGGTTGGTVEAQIGLTKFFQLRGGYNYFEYDLDETYDDIAYTGALDLTTTGAFLDIHPFGGSFFISGGAFIGDKGLDLNATPATNVEIGNETYTPAEVGSLGLSVAMEETAPFLGFGWDTTFQGSGPFGFKLLIGAMQTGTPLIDLSATGGTLASDPDFQAELANEEVNLQSEVEEFEYYPVIQIGLTLGF